MRRGSQEHSEAMLRVAQLYYEKDLTQDQIARRLILTRWKVGRLLDNAKDAGIVRIQIVHPQARQHNLESALVDTYGLDHAVVVPGGEEPGAQRRTVARAAAEFLCDLKPEPRILGVSWGRTLDDVAAAMPSGWTRGIEVVQINGAVSRSRRPSSGADVATEIARQGLGAVSLLSAPAIVEKAATRVALEADPSVGKVLAVARKADVLLYSAGELSTESVLVDAGYLNRDAVEELRQRGATGDLLGRFIRADGHEVDEGLRDRTVALTLDEIRRAPCTVAVASGRAKAGIARAAAANGLCTVLVTDSDVAAELLESS